MRCATRLNSGEHFLHNWEWAFPYMFYMLKFCQWIEVEIFIIRVKYYMYQWLYTLLILCIKVIIISKIQWLGKKIVKINIKRLF